MMALLAALEHTAFATWVREANTVWAYPTVLTLHTVGLAVLVGANAAVDLRFLGFGRQIALAEMERFFPAMWAGFWLNAITGAMLFTIDATTKDDAAMRRWYCERAVSRKALSPTCIGWMSGREVMISGHWKAFQLP